MKFGRNLLLDLAMKGLKSGEETKRKGLNPLSTSNEKRFNKVSLQTSRKDTYGQFDLFFFSVDSEWPKAFHVLSFEEGHLRNTSILFKHVQSAGLSTLGSLGHACEIQR